MHRMVQAGRRPAVVRSAAVTKLASMPPSRDGDHTAASHSTADAPRPPPVAAASSDNDMAADALCALEHSGPCKAAPASPQLPADVPAPHDEKAIQEVGTHLGLVYIFHDSLCWMLPMVAVLTGQHATQ